MDLASLVTQCLADFVAIAELAGIDLGIGRRERCEVLAARADLAVLFSNLIDNAFRYTPAGGSVDCEIMRTNEGAVVTIVDTGPGVPSELLPRLHLAKRRGRSS